MILVPSDFIAHRSGEAKLDRAIEKANSEFIAVMKTGNAAVIAAPYSESAVFIAIDGITVWQRQTDRESKILRNVVLP